MGRCILCPTGRQPTDDHATCAVCPAGRAGTAGRCNACPQYETPTPEKDRCSLHQVTCDPGNEPRHSRTECSACPKGKYSADGDACQTCSPGSQPDRDRDACEPCPAGQYSADGTECKPCGLGHEPYERTNCTACAIGLISNPGPVENAVTLSGGQCVRCNVGFRASNQNDTCGDINECNDPSYSCDAGHKPPLSKCTNTKGGFQCSPCPVGYDIIQPNRTSADAALWTSYTCRDHDECHPENTPAGANVTLQPNATTLAGALHPGDPACSSRANCTNLPGSFTCSVRTLHCPRAVVSE
jgi:hypothetical protein